jgi:hypothetical protein
MIDISLKTDIEMADFSSGALKTARYNVSDTETKNIK